MKKKKTLQKKAAKKAPTKAQPIIQAVAVVEEKPKMEVAVVSRMPIPPALNLDFSNSFVHTEKGNLFPIMLGSFDNDSTPIQEQFKTGEELFNLVLQNKKTIFGENSLFINERIEKHFEQLGIFNFDAILLDLRDSVRPKLYLAVITFPDENYVKLFFRITDYFTFNRHPEAQEMMTEALSKAINGNEELKKELQEKIGSNDIEEFIQRMLWSKPAILLIMDTVWRELSLFMKTYAETWGEFVKPMVIQKFKQSGDTFVAIQPSFETFGKEKKRADKVVKTTEEAHLEAVSLVVKEVYGKIKAELLKEDAGLLFNVQKNYISLRRDRNLAFFHLRKKNLYLVVMCAEKEVRRAVKHYIVKSLPPSVQKFWNGESTGLVIEHERHLEEIIDLLKKLAGTKINGNPVDGGQTQSKVQVHAQGTTKVKKDTKAKPDARPTVKKK